jgi:hypothetical protein
MFRIRDSSFGYFGNITDNQASIDFIMAQAGNVEERVPGNNYDYM